MKIVVQQQAFDAGAEITAIASGNRKIGAVASFVGLVRDVNDGDAVATLTLEHYPGMTEREIGKIVDEAARRWDVLGCTVIHRVGTLQPAEPIVLVVVASGHRGDAFSACEFIMDYLKTRAPFWKKELTGDGERWVAARASDDAAAGRWAKPQEPQSGWLDAGSQPLGDKA